MVLNTWNRLEAVGKIKEPRCIELDGVLSALTPQGVLDRRGVRLIPAGESEKLAARTADWLGTGAELRGLTNWPKLRRTFIDLTRSFFPAQCTGWVYYESCRDSLKHQEARTVQTPVAWRPFSRPSKRSPYKFDYDYSHTFPVVSLVCGSLNFHHPDDKATGFVRYSRSRQIGTRLAYFDTWCRTDVAEERHLLETGRCRAILDLQRDDVNIGRLLNWVAVNKEGDLSAFTLEVAPVNGKVASVRRTVVPMELFHTIHPRYEEWFTRLLGDNPADLPQVSLEAAMRQIARDKLLQTCLRVFGEVMARGSLGKATGGAKGAKARINTLERVLDVKLVKSSTNIRLVDEKMLRNNSHVLAEGEMLFGVLKELGIIHTNVDIHPALR